MPDKLKRAVVPILQAGQGEDSQADRELQNKALPQPVAKPKAYSPRLSSSVCTGYVRDTDKLKQTLDNRLLERQSD